MNYYNKYKKVKKEYLEEKFGTVIKNIGGGGNKKTTIHLSGTPGSGKSTLGVKLSKMFPNFKVVETDLFVSHEDRKKRDTYESFDDKLEFIFDIYRNKFKYFNNKYDKIIYVGILDSSVPEGNLFTEQDFDHKIFLDVTPIELIKRYYTREVKNGILTDDKFINQVIEGSWYILSSKEVMEWHKKKLDKHIKLGYKLMAEEEIIDLVNSLNSK